MRGGALAAILAIGSAIAPRTARADPSPDAAAAGEVPTPPHRDLGTRWVYAAAIGGLVVGGAIARYRKRRASPSE